MTHRLAFIDVLRGLAVVWMIETHVLNVCLDPLSKKGWLYGMLHMSNGFVAVAFVFCAGAGFWLAAERKADEYRRFSPSLWIYLRRLGFILALGYWINLARPSLRRLLMAIPSEMRLFATCDILHAIVASSLLALLILFFVRRTGRLRVIYAVMALAIFFATPLVWARDPLSLPVMIASYVSRPPIGKFPLFPWMGYFFAGAAITAVLRGAGNKFRFALIVGVVSFLAPLLIFYVKDLPFTYPGWDDWWYASPGHAFFRLSRVIFLFSLLYLLEGVIRERRLTRVLQVFGQESLLLYVGHIMVVYGSSINPGFQDSIPGALSPLSTFWVTVFLVIGCYFVAVLWHRYKALTPRRARLLVATMISLFLVLFLVTT